MAYAYDPENIFAMILRGDIPCDKVFENEHALAFRDIAPQAPVHILVIPKGAYVTYDHFAAAASDSELVGFSRAVAEVAKIAGVTSDDGTGGFRAISNAGPDGVQEVPHYHLHVLGGRRIGPMIVRRD
jgi:histidine triad (HIT) family protein